MNYLLIPLFLIGFTLVAFKLLQHSLCPTPRIVYKIINKTPLDYQFNDINLPSNNFQDMFTSDNITVGGYKLSSGRTVPSQT